MLRFLKTFLGSKSKRAQTRAPRSGDRRPRSTRLEVERLDERLLLATAVTAMASSDALSPMALNTLVNPSGVRVDRVENHVLNAVVNGQVLIEGRPDNDHVEIDLVNGQYRVTRNMLLAKPISPGLGSVGKPLYGSEVKYYNPSQFPGGFVFYGNGGYDDFVNNTSAATTAYGGPEADWFYGGSGTDTFYGGGGPDILVGGGGADVLYGGPGDDELEGGGGADALNGGAGYDSLEGGSDNDTLDGGADGDVYAFPMSNLGTDTVTEAADVDSDALDFTQHAYGVTVDLALTSTQAVSPALTLTLSTTTGLENVGGTAFGDSIKGNSRDNWLAGHGDNDLLYGRLGSNTLSDGLGDDYVDFTQNTVPITYTTGGGNDIVYGTEFDDQITGSSGNDELHGGLGSNTLSDGLGDDYVDFSQNAVGITYTTGGGNDIVFGTGFADHITGSGGDDELWGRGGSDYLEGGAGTDALDGGGMPGSPGGDWLDPGSPGEVADGGWNAHKWAENGTTFDDVIQQGSPTCVFLASLAAAAEAGHDLAGRITYVGNFTYNVSLYRPETGWIERSVYFDGNYTNYAISGEEEFGEQFDDPAPRGYEFWTILYQRAFLDEMVYLEYDGDHVGSEPGITLLMLTGQTTFEHWYSDSWDDPQWMHDLLANGGSVIVCNADDDENSMVVSEHCYTVLAVEWDVTQNDWLVTLYNPWGYDGGDVPSGNELDGIIVMSWSAMYDEPCDFDIMAHTTP